METMTQMAARGDNVREQILRKRERSYHREANMVMSSATTSRVLVRLSDITQELTVGLGNATASVRTLTDVSLVVRARELVVLSGSRGAGERAVLAVVAGDRRGVLGTCEVAEDARLRVMRIGARSALALVQEWQRANAHEALKPAGVRPDVFLLDVVPDVEASARAHPGQRVQTSATRTSTRAGANTNTSRVRETRVHSGPDGDARIFIPKPWDEKNRTALKAWAEVCRMRGGAVIMAAGDAVGRGIFDAALSHVRRQSRVMPVAPHTVREVLLEESTVRVVAMHSGRLASTVRFRRHDLPA